MQIETQARERTGRANTNFDARLPAPQSDLARETLKEPYRFDFLGLGNEAQERDVEDALMSHISGFLIELGAGFAFVGRQVHLEVGGGKPRPELISGAVRMAAVRLSSGVDHVQLSSGHAPDNMLAA